MKIKFIVFTPLLSLFISGTTIFAMESKEEVSEEKLAKRPEVINRIIEEGPIEQLIPTFVDAIDDPENRAAIIISLIGDPRLLGGDVEMSLLNSFDNLLDTLTYDKRVTLLKPLQKDPAYYRFLNRALINKKYQLVLDLVSYTKFLPLKEEFNALKEIEKQWLEANEEGKDMLESIAITAKINPDFADENGTTPLMRAAQRNDAGTIFGLFKLGANPTITNKEGKTALDIAKENNNQEAQKTLQGIIQEWKKTGD